MEFTERQQQILETALELIAAKGIQHLTTKNLALSMNFTEPAIYRHFKNKTAILEGILLFYQGQMKDQVKLILKNEQNALQQLLKMLSIQFEHFSKNPAMAMMVFSEVIFQNEEVLSQRVQKIIASKVELTQNIIKKGQASGEIRTDVDAAHLATMYIGSMRFTLLKWKLENYSFDLVKESQILNTTLSTLMR